MSIVINALISSKCKKCWKSKCKTIYLYFLCEMLINESFGVTPDYATLHWNLCHEVTKTQMSSRKFVKYSKTTKKWDIVKTCQTTM